MAIDFGGDGGMGFRFEICSFNSLFVPNLPFVIPQFLLFSNQKDLNRKIQIKKHSVFKDLFLKF